MKHGFIAKISIALVIFDGNNNFSSKKNCIVLHIVKI